MLTALMDISSFCLFNPLGLVECLLVNFIDENCVEYQLRAPLLGLARSK